MPVRSSSCLLLLVFALVAGCGERTPTQVSAPAPAVTAASAANAHWQYDDRDLWLALPTAEETFGDDTLTVHRVDQPAADGSKLFLLLGEPAVPNNGDARLMQALAEAHPHSAVWYLDTPDALFIERERLALRNHDGAFLVPMLDRLAREYAAITLVAMDVSAVPLLRGIRQWQAAADDAARAALAHVVLLYPSLYVNTPAAGEARALFPVVRDTALPVTIVQPGHGAQATTITETVAALEAGGSLVQLLRVEDATDGLYKYERIEASAVALAAQLAEAERDIAALKQRQDFKLRQLPPYDIAAEPTSTIVAGLKPLPADAVPLQDIRLQTHDGKPVDLRRDYAGRAVLLTFWATWCPACVEEIPSMNRALAQLDRERFAIVSVSFRDAPARMARFAEQTPMDFPVLMDLDGAVSEAWRVFAFPSSFLIDRSGRVRYSINTGALWDSPELLEKLREISASPVAPPVAPPG